ncbi:MAG: tRNA (guanosine(46)-N7)-methyltransferase TrmB, partial [Anaeroplasmataceae bacterium]|nr:tRNA (guanosine(46)-N7)-methyltransferase TrmB [Anaeroplasmataceae bacterium]
AYERLKENKNYFIENPLECKGKWSQVFQNQNPIHIEIGCGKGQFIKELAGLHPDINYIAIEKYDSVLLRASEKLENLNLPNLRLILLDATHIEDAFANGEVSLIYINFSDPWPKSAHKKRRLTYKTFLESYSHILKPEGAIYQKTDNRKLFEFSLESFNENDWLISNISLDLHQDKEIFNIETEFEEKWSKLGPIYRLEARKRR